MMSNKLSKEMQVDLLAEQAIEDIEVLLLVEAIYWRWGYDFRDYAPESLKRGIRRMVMLEGVATVSALQERLLRDPACLWRYLEQSTVNVTSMFRDPGFYSALRLLVVSLLQQQPSLRIWNAGCASGQEVYSLAILLHEEGLLDRTSIYATDISQTGLEVAKAGIYPLAKLQEYTVSYQAGGGKATFSDYYHTGHGRIIMHAELSKSVLWAQHNLVTDASFNEFNLILCRNVLMYFNRRLQQRVHHLLYDSLTAEGVLVLGRKESLQLTPHESCFRTLDLREKIYQRVQ
jgi:chemotaxis protein methyltransferase CheR